MKRYLFILILFCSSLFGYAQNSSTIDFTIKNLGINVNGHFNEFTIKTAFDSVGILNNISSKIDVSSIKTGIDKRDEHLLGEDYFYTNKYKFITLESTILNKKGDNKYVVKANLTIKGITKEVLINLNVEELKDSFKVTSSFEINRNDFDVGGSSFVMGNNVKINVIQYEKH